MADTGADVEQVIDEVLRAEYDAEDDVVVEDDAQEGYEQADEIDEAHACGPLDDVSSEDLVPPPDVVAAALDLVTVSALDGVPLFYARGVPPRPQSFPIDRRFRDVVVATVRSVRFRAPRSFGDLVRITSAGAFVQKPGMHGLGRAFDHDAWTFEHVDIRPIRRDHVGGSLARRRRYWALAALMRTHSAFVLHGHYDAAHEDHIHQDNASTVPFRTTSEATVKLAQAICNHIFRQSPALVIDGDFGPLSRAAVRSAMRRVDLAGDVFDSTQWRRFLFRSGRLGFELSAPS